MEVKFFQGSVSQVFSLFGGFVAVDVLRTTSNLGCKQRTIYLAVFGAKKLKQVNSSPSSILLLLLFESQGSVLDSPHYLITFIN